ncbi:hypothetical protein, partial [Vibrio cholerae]|uniref:hypothetical protein n=1 Tax=Vibrio cholerae TaxID=666 RepID=UPI001E432C97
LRYKKAHLSGLFCGSMMRSNRFAQTCITASMMFLFHRLSAYYVVRRYVEGQSSVPLRQH